MVLPGPLPGGGGGETGGRGGETGGVPMGPKPPKVVNGGDENIPVGGVVVGPGVNMGFIVDPSGLVPSGFMVIVSRKVVGVAYWGS